MVPLSRATHFTPHDRMVLRRIKEAVLEIIPDAEVILYGSRARGTAHAESDWDVLVLTDAPESLDLEKRVWLGIDAVELDTAEIIGITVHNRHEWAAPRWTVVPYHEEIEREGIRI
ncbi:MAG TPA: nucleotidyltransferase domain-containing protein [Armatimonadota bacterium]|nr:nucleotidyltransferase domain-containing protein [Armatimonadota bacterium]HOS42812.1 nucleotidyltransferase domain-containing protein [Armatimonadota bacterium]